MSRRIYFHGLLLLFAALTVGAVAEPAAEELERQRHQLEAWRKHPEQMARLRQDLQAFLILPAERREQIIKLDHDLHREPPATQTRLWHVLERYADWLEQLPENDQQAIKQARDKTARLALIRTLRDQEWMRTQPKAIREKWAQLPGGERAGFVKRLRAEERKQHQQWQFAARFWRELEGQETLPSRLSDLSPKVQKYVHEYLLKMLSDAEKQQLTQAEGRWPDYPRTLAEIAHRHPAALPPSPQELPRTLAQLPIPVYLRVTADKKGTGKRIVIAGLKPFITGSPSFTSKVVEFGTKNGQVPFENEFWACNFKALRPPMKDFVDNKLYPALKDNDDKRKLSDTEGKWPYYPQTIQELSQKYHLHPPWFFLPDAEKYHWDHYLAKDKPST